MHLTFSAKQIYSFGTAAKSAVGIRTPQVNRAHNRAMRFFCVRA